MTWIVFTKELVDHLRDRRSILGSLALPIIGPIMLWAVIQLVSNLQRERALELPIVGAEHAPRLVEYLVASGVKTLPPPADAEGEVRRGELAAVLVIDSDFPKRFGAGKTARVRLIHDDSQSKAQRSVRRIERLLLTYSQTIGALRLIARGISPEVAVPVMVSDVDLATAEKLAANLLNMIPLFLMLAALVGGMNVAIDTTAGERERGSLEPLLLNPVPRLELALGKWLAAVVASSGVAVLTLATFMITVRFLPVEKLGLRVLLGPYEGIMMLAVVLPLAWFGSALQMLIATFARTFKEAQTYLNLLNLLPLAPSLYWMLQPADGAAWMLPVPALAQVSTVTGVMRGDLVPWWHLLVIAATSATYTAICIWGMVRLLLREKIIFGRG